MRRPPVVIRSPGRLTGVTVLVLASASPARLESILESLLFASDRPLPVNDLKRLVGERAGAKVTAALEALRARRDEEGSGVQVVEVAGGWHLRTRHDK